MDRQREAYAEAASYDIWDEYAEDWVNHSEPLPREAYEEAGWDQGAEPSKGHQEAVDALLKRIMSSSAPDSSEEQSAYRDNGGG